MTTKHILALPQRNGGAERRQEMFLKSGNDKKAKRIWYVQVIARGIGVDREGNLWIGKMDFPDINSAIQSFTDILSYLKSIFRVATEQLEFIQRTEKLRQELSNNPNQTEKLKDFISQAEKLKKIEDIQTNTSAEIREIAEDIITVSSAISSSSIVGSTIDFLVFIMEKILERGKSNEYYQDRMTESHFHLSSEGIDLKKEISNLSKIIDKITNILDNLTKEKERCKKIIEASRECWNDIYEVITEQKKKKINLRDLYKTQQGLKSIHVNPYTTPVYKAIKLIPRTWNRDRFAKGLKEAIGVLQQVNN